MIDMLQNAKDLIAKGKALNDPELIQMGMDLLEQYDIQKVTGDIKQTVDVGEFKNSDSYETVEDPQYVCQNCGHTMPVDKEGRKRCPECKKHKLVVDKPVVSDKPKPPAYNELLTALENQQLQPQPGNSIDMDQFHMQVRGNTSDSRYHYDENGNIDGVIRRREEVDPNLITNVWQDEGEFADIDKDDPVNEHLKKVTKVSARTRRPPNYIEVQCDSCNRVEKVHPIHAGGRGRHICTKCVGRRSQR